MLGVPHCFSSWIQGVLPHLSIHLYVSVDAYLRRCWLQALATIPGVFNMGLVVRPCEASILLAKPSPQVLACVTGTGVSVWHSWVW